eukprot:scaffold1845_cov257-Pinguiococcus_pyrenoidosus.AAC.6
MLRKRKGLSQAWRERTALELPLLLLERLGEQLSIDELADVGCHRVPRDGDGKQGEEADESQAEHDEHRGQPTVGFLPGRVDVLDRNGEVDRNDELDELQHVDEQPRLAQPEQAFLVVPRRRGDAVECIRHRTDRLASCNSPLVPASVCGHDVRLGLVWVVVNEVGVQQPPVDVIDFEIDQAGHGDYEGAQDCHDGRDVWALERLIVNALDEEVDGHDPRDEHPRAAADFHQLQHHVLLALLQVAGKGEVLRHVIRTNEVCAELMEPSPAA